MKKLITLAACYLIYLVSFAQAPGTITTVEGVYGGRINAIVGGQFGSTDSFRLIVATESANSIFYATGNFPSAGTASVGTFTALPSANAAAGYGSSISKIAYHATSQTIYFIANGNIYSTNTSASSATKLTTSGNYIDIKLSGNHFFALTATGSNNVVYYSTINSSTGVLTASSNVNLAGIGYTNLVLGQDDYLYIFKSGTDPHSAKFSTTTISAGVTLSAYTSDALSSLLTSYSWDAMGVYTDGTTFIGGTNGGTNPYKYVAKAPRFDTAFNTIATNISGTSGSNIEFRTAALGNYYVYFGTAYSNNKGKSSTWTEFGNSGQDSHPNDGYVTYFKDGASGGIALLTSDLGLAWTKNSGSVIADVTDGILATQIEDFDMNTSKTFGWLAAKDGIRYVNNFNTAAKAWTTSIWPNGDGSPYYSAEMVGDDTNKVYVGNVRIYKSVSKGATGSWSQVFTPENAPYSFPSVGVRAEAIAVSSQDTNIVMVGYYNQNSGQYGGVFYSSNGGGSWTQLLIRASSAGQDINVNDIEFTYDSGKIVAYIGVEYYNTTYKGMYKATWNGASFTVAEEPIYSGTGVKYSVTDIIIPSKDTIAAVGAFYNSTLGHTYPIYFNISRTVMNSWRSTVVDTTRTGTYTACAWNNDTIFYAYSNHVYYDVISFHSTSTSRVGEALYADIDNGTEINVLYYDDLMIGSTTGLVGVRGASTIHSEPIEPTITIEANKTAACVGQSITFTATVSNANNPTYTWKINNVVMGNGSSFTTSALSNNASVTCTISADGQTVTSDAIVVTIYGSPFIASITGDTSTCTIGSTKTLSSVTNGGIWSSSNTSVATVSNTGVVTSVSNGFSTISYTVTNSNGCANSMTRIFNVAPQVTPIISGTSNVCVGSNITLTNNTPNTTSVWSSIAGRATISNGGVVTGTSSGTATIKLIATNSFGCSNSNTYNVTVNALPAAPSVAYATGTASPQSTSVGGVPTFCKTRTFTLVGYPAGGSWTSSNTAVFTINNSGVVNTIGLGTATVSYTISSSNGCTNSKTITGAVVNCGSKAVVSNAIPENNIKVFPNPAHSFVNIQVEKVSGQSVVVITDLSGKVVKQQVLSLGKNVIDINNMAKGLYLVSMEVNGERKVEKLIVE